MCTILCAGILRYCPLGDLYAAGSLYSPEIARLVNCSRYGSAAAGGRTGTSDAKIRTFITAAAHAPRRAGAALPPEGAPQGAADQRDQGGGKSAQEEAASSSEGG